MKKEKSTGVLMAKKLNGEIFGCPVCNKGMMEKSNDAIKQDGIEFEIMRCSSCKEELLTMEQLKSVADQYRQLRKAKEVTFSKWGNSIAVRIPNDVVEEYHITTGMSALLTRDKNRISLRPHS